MASNDDIADIKTGMQQMLANMEKLTVSNVELKQSQASLEVNLTKKVDETLKSFQDSLKSDMKGMNDKIAEADAAMRDLAEQMKQLKERTSKLESSGASSSGGFSAPGFGPGPAAAQKEPPGSPGQAPQKGAKLHWGSSIRGTRSHSQPPPPRSGGGGGNNKLTLRVAGFGREISKELRKAHYDKFVLPILPATAAGGFEVKYPHMADHLLLVFEDEDIFYEALNMVRDQTSVWHDPLFKRNQTIYHKRDKTLESRQIGRFRHFFYDGITDLLKDKYGFAGAPKLTMVRGKIMVAHFDDHMPLLAFSRVLCRDRSGVDIVDESWDLLKVPKADVVKMVDDSLQAAVADARE